MKALNRIFFALTTTALLVAPAGALAQAQLSGPNGTAMSPKMRHLLTQRETQLVIPAVTDQSVRPWPANTTQIAATPKQRQLETQRQTSGVAPQAGNVSFYQPTGPDGITASPKLRQQLDEQAMQFQIAPLK